MSESASLLAGPAVGGFLVRARRPDPQPERSTGPAQPGRLRRDIAEGVHVSPGPRMLRPLVGATGTPNAGFSMAWAILTDWSAPGT